jgi:hypothetical protein
MPSGLSRSSTSVNSSISAAVTVIVAKAGFYESKVSSAELADGFELLDTVEMAFLRLEGVLAIIPPLQFISISWKSIAA